MAWNKIDTMIVFPAICPVCSSPSGRRVIPLSPDVRTFRCDACRHEWSEASLAVKTEEAKDAARGFRLLFPRRKA